jgi:hypothetical protein
MKLAMHQPHTESTSHWHRKQSLIETLNNSSPKTDPHATPDTTTEGNEDTEGKNIRMSLH